MAKNTVSCSTGFVIFGPIAIGLSFIGHIHLSLPFINRYDVIGL